MALTKVTGHVVLPTTNIEFHNTKSTGIVTFTDTTQSTSTITGGLQIAGGVGIVKNLNVGGDLNVTGNLTYTDVDNINSVGIITANAGVILKHSASGKFARLLSNAAGAAIIQSDPDNNAANSSISFHVDGGEKARITTDGEVGINTTVVPYGNFAVDHGQYGLTRISNHSHLLLQNKNAGNTTFWSLIPRDDARFGIGRGTPDANGTVSESDEKFTILSNGKVGIGTHNPDSILHLSGSAPRIKLTDTAGTDDIAKIFSTGGSLYFQQRDGSSHGNIIFRTEDNSGAEERLRIKSDGKVGVDATDPQVLLDVGGSSSGGLNGLTNSVLYAGFTNNTNFGGVVLGAGANGNSPFIAASKKSDGTALSLDLITSGSKRLRIDSDGAVNIGSNPAQATGAYTQYAVLTAKGYPANETSASILALVRGNNTTSTAAGHTLGRIVFSDKQAGEYAMIEGQAEHNGAVGDTPGRIIFATTSDGATSPTEKIRIDLGGNLDLTGGGNIIINDNKKLYFEGDRDDDFNCIGRQNSENSIVLTSRYNLANIIDSNNDDTASFWSVRHNGTTVAGSSQLLRVQSDGHIVTQGLSSYSFNNDGNNAKVLEVTGDGTVGEYGVINISGNQNATTSLVGAVKFINRENVHSSSGSAIQSRSIATIDVFTVTQDNNAGDDCGGMLRIVNKAEGAGNAETIRFNSDGTIRAGGGTFVEPAIRLVLNNPNASNSQMQFQDTSTGNSSTDGFRVGYNGVGGQLWNFENNYVRIATNNKERFTIAGNGTLYHRSDSTQSLGTTALVTLENPEGNAQTGTVLKLKTGRGQGVKDMPIFHIIDGTDQSIFEVENSGRVGIYNASPQFLIDIVNNTSAEGIRLRSTGNTYHDFYFDAARTAANTHIGRIIARWNGNNTSMISMNTGSDVTNKDNGYISFCASEAGSALTERFRCDGSAAGLVMKNDCYIEIPHDERCIVFDEGQKMITSNDGQGNFNIFGGKNHDAQHVSSTSGNSGIAQIEINSDGANGNINFAVGPTRSAGSTANFEKGFQLVYHSNTSADRLNGLKYTTGSSTSPGGLGTQYPVLHRGNCEDGSWNNVSGGGFKVLGDGGSIAITTNDGYGNCNVCWNHKDGVPDTAGSAWRIRCDIDGTNSDMNFQTASSVSNGSAVNVGSRMVLASNGNLQIDGTLTQSDQRLKSNIQTITGATDKIKALTGKTFKWKDGLGMPSGTKYGFIAQEVESVIPDLVDESRIRGFDKDGNITQDHYHNKDDIVEWSKSIDNNGIAPILVEALKEALSEIDSLKARVSTLEGS